MKETLQLIGRERPILLYISLVVAVLCQVLIFTDYQPPTNSPDVISLVIIAGLTTLAFIVKTRYRIEGLLFIASIVFTVGGMVVITFFGLHNPFEMAISLWLALNLMSSILFIQVVFYILNTYLQIQEAKRQEH